MRTHVLLPSTARLKLYSPGYEELEVYIATESSVSFAQETKQVGLNRFRDGSSACDVTVLG
jgi:hypothetical protein